MQSKLRKINVHKTDFKYLIDEKYQTTSGGYWITIVKIFQEPFKQNYLEIKFESADGYPAGNLLTSGVRLDVEQFNLHTPSSIRQLIEAAIARKWNWKHAKLEISDGLEVLRALGYNATSLKPHNK